MNKALADLKEIHDQAESLLADFDFQAAAEHSEVVASQTDTRLQHYTSWHEDFSARLESSRTSEYARLEELLQEAKTHEQVHDYNSASRTIAQVHSSLKQTTILGISDTAGEIDQRLTIKQARLKELEGIVRERVSKRDVAELLPLVNELLMLKPDRPEVKKLKLQLEQRTSDMVAYRDEACEQATQNISEQEYEEAIATLDAVSEEVSNQQLTDLRIKANDYLNQLNNLREQITTAVGAKQFNDLLSVIDQCLILKADQDDLLEMKEKLVNREAKLDTRHQQITSQALEYLQLLQFDAAIGTLSAIAPEYQTLSTLALYQRVTEEKANAITTALSEGDWKTALSLDGNNIQALQLRNSEMRSALVVDDNKKLKTNRTANTNAVVSLTTGLLSVVTCGCGFPLGVAAIVTGILAMQKCSRGAGNGWGMALAGLISGFAGIIWSLVLILASLA
ncbi:MAG: DUF4190 domain-containing protein [Planctomycetaceae bacterium]|nr:DUF4190 domain-containing protein [Planctomycetaceae bacterium]